MEEFLIKKYVQEALNEDLYPYGDITSENLPEKDKIVKAYIFSKEAAILCGIKFAIYSFKFIDEGIKLEVLANDGDELVSGQKVLILEGKISSILKAERVALNFLMYLSGISTLTKKFVKQLFRSSIKICDTRKTRPTLRALEKYAVKIGGGKNHRFNLSHFVMLKDNHIKVAGSIGKAISQIKKNLSHTCKIEVEIENLKQLKEALNYAPDIVMLDNMPPEMIKEALKLIDNKNKKVIVEVSGGVTLDNINSYIIDGVDYISSGAIIHQAKFIDFSLEIC